MSTHTLVEALERIGAIKRWPWGYSRGNGSVLEWMCHSCRCKFPDRGDENGQCPVTETSCPSAIARTALATHRAGTGEPLRHNGHVVSAVSDVLDCYGMRVAEKERAVPEILDAIEANLPATATPSRTTTGEPT